MNNYDQDENIDIPVLSDIKHVYQLRHFANIFGEDIIASILKIHVKRLIHIYESDIHGSKDLQPLLGKNFNKNFDRYVEEEIERESHILEAQEKNYYLIKDLKEKRKNFATIGTNKAKRRLNKISNNNVLAKALRIALEIEDKNILAKDSQGDYQLRIYNQKYLLIVDLLKLFKENNWIYGQQESNNISALNVVYFDFPSGEQISWHCNLVEKDAPIYEKEWDQQENSTLDKLNNMIYNLLKENYLIEK